MTSERFTVPKPEHGSDKWLQLRHRYDGNPVFTASEAACIHRQHPYKSLTEFVNDKIDETPIVSPTNEAMERGNRLEPVLLDWVGDKLNRPVISPQQMYGWRRTPENLILMSTLDGMTSDGDVVEIKTTNRHFDPESPLPPMWHWQGVHQAITVGVDKIIWGVFDASLTLHIVEQQISDDDIAQHIDTAVEVLAAVLTADIPAEWAEKYDDVTRIIEQPGTSCDVSSLESHIAELRDVQREVRMLRSHEDRLKMAIGKTMREHTIGTIDDKPVITWKTQRRQSFDTRSFQEEHPDIAGQYTYYTAYRVMRFPK